ncbi:MAG: molybdate ABC transporter substrate-binding protein [Dongiaceae bacterium]
MGTTMLQGLFRFSRRALLIGIAAVLALIGGVATILAADQKVTVFAASSLTDVLKAAAATWQSKGNGAIVLSFGSSSTIAKQIEQGAPADIFASADETWMAYLVERNLIAGDTVRRPIGNDLVLVGAPGTSHIIKIEPGFDLLSALRGGRLAIGDPKSVPAGRYARQALTNLGVWDKIAPHLAPAPNVRAALALVQRGEAPLGIVYATDAMGLGEMKMLTLFPEDSHDPIVYPMAIVAGRDRPDAKAFFDFLTGPDGLALFGRYGFKILE